MLQEIKGRVRDGSGLAFETTLSGRQYGRLISRRQAPGYHVKLITPQPSSENGVPAAR